MDERRRRNVPKPPKKKKKKKKKKNIDWVCGVGDVVMARWQGDQNFYPATITGYDASRDAVKVRWLDGDTRFPTVRTYETFGCRASNAPQNVITMPHDHIAPNPGYKLILSTSGGTKTCSSRSLIFTVEWPAVHNLDQCAALCYQDEKCTYIFFQMINRARPGGLLCQGFSTCDVNGRLSPKEGGYGETFHVATTGTRARPSPAASFWSESAQDNCRQAGCKLEWIDDGECQTVCSGLECMNDGGDCKSEVRSFWDSNLEHPFIDLEQYRGSAKLTAVGRMLAARANVRALSNFTLGDDWSAVRETLNQACGIQSLANLPSSSDSSSDSASIPFFAVNERRTSDSRNQEFKKYFKTMPGLGYTGHCFDDGVHMDCCTMLAHPDRPEDLSPVSDDKLELRAPLGPGVRAGTRLASRVRGASWCTAQKLDTGDERQNRDPKPQSVCEATYHAKRAFKLVWCPERKKPINGEDDYARFIVVDEDGDLLTTGRPTNPPKLKLRRLSFEAVKGTRFALGCEIDFDAEEGVCEGESCASSY